MNLPAIISEESELAQKIAASAGMGISRIQVRLDPEYVLVFGSHSDYAKLGEWAWVGREE